MPKVCIFWQLLLHLHQITIFFHTMQHKLSTWSWVLTANFSEGLPYTIINVLLVALLADMGCSNGVAAMIPSLLALPWMWKFLWAPFVDVHSSKRHWMVLMQAFLCLAFILIAAGLKTSFWLILVIVGSIIAAMASATYDVACDGYYMIALDKQQQSFFVGIRSTAYRLGMLFASGFLIILAKEGSSSSWSITLMIAAFLMAVLCAFNKWITRFLTPLQAATPTDNTPKRTFSETVRSFIKQHAGKDLAFMLCFILFYRLGEAFLSKMTILFLKDSIENGGMGLNNEQYGIIYGTFGILALVIGGILGGICISRWGLTRCLIPMVLALDLPDLLYVWMATDSTLFTLHPSLLGFSVAIEQFGYGFGFTAFTVYLLECAKGPFQTSHYAFLTALMAFGLMIPSTLSGYVQETLGSYTNYFLLAFILTIPGILLSIWYVKKTSRITSSL